MAQSKTAFVKTEYFSVQANEENETNKGVYGKEFAEWIRVRLQDKYQNVSAIYPEDYGWNISINSKSYSIHVICANRVDSKFEWGAFVVVHQSLMQKIFGEKVDQKILDEAFEYILKSMNDIPGVYDLDVE